jgi:hypothetical protein
MDMLESVQQNQPIPAAAGFSLGVGGTCGSASSGTICRYASDNGFAADGSDVGVSWTFPASISGTANTPASGVSHPYLQVLISKIVSTGFMGLFPFVPKTIKVQESASCGIASVATQGTPLPGIILFATGNGGPDLNDMLNNGSETGFGTTSYYGQGTVSVFKVVGGGQQAIYSNAAGYLAYHVRYDRNGNPVYYNEGLRGEFGAKTDVSLAGPQYSGGDISTVSTSSIEDFIRGQETQVNQGVQPTGDPLSWVNEGDFAPADRSPSHAPVNVSYGQDGCPDHRGCLEFFPGSYSSLFFSTAATLQGYGFTSAVTSTQPIYSNSGTAIFMPGVYYMTGPLWSDGEVLRNATPCTPSCGSITASSLQGLQSGEAGVVFYFAADDLPGYQPQGSAAVPDGAGVSDLSDGPQDIGGPVVVSIDDPSDVSEIDPVSVASLSCSGSAPAGNNVAPLPSGAEEGTVLLAECDSRGAWDYENESSSGGPGQYAPNVSSRGILFFVSRNFDNGASLSIATQKTFPQILGGSIYAYNNNYASVGTLLDFQNDYAVAQAGGGRAFPDPGNVFVLGSIFAGGVQLGGVNMTVYPSLLYQSNSGGSSTLKAAQF